MKFIHVIKVFKQKTFCIRKHVVFFYINSESKLTINMILTAWIKIFVIFHINSYTSMKYFMLVRNM